MDLNAIQYVAQKYGNTKASSDNFLKIFPNPFTQGYIYSTGTEKLSAPTQIINNNGSGGALVLETFGSKNNKQVAVGIGIDCSNLVYQGLLNAGYNVKYTSTSAIGTPADTNFVKVGTPQVGDLVLFRDAKGQGHVGFVTSEIDEKTGKGTFYGSQSSTGPAETEFSANGNSSDFFGKTFVGYYRVKDSLYDPAAAAQKLAPIDAKAAFLRNQLDNLDQPTIRDLVKGLQKRGDLGSDQELALDLESKSGDVDGQGLVQTARLTDENGEVFSLRLVSQRAQGDGEGEIVTTSELRNAQGQLVRKVVRTDYPEDSESGLKSEADITDFTSGVETARTHEETNLRGQTTSDTENLNPATGVISTYESGYTDANGDEVTDTLDASKRLIKREIASDETTTTQNFDSRGRVLSESIENTPEFGPQTTTTKDYDPTTGHLTSLNTETYDPTTGATVETTKTYDITTGALKTHEETLTRNDESYTIVEYDTSGLGKGRWDFVPDPSGDGSGVEFETRADGTVIKRFFDADDNQIGADETVKNGAATYEQARRAALCIHQHEDRRGIADDHEFHRAARRPAGARAGDGGVTCAALSRGSRERVACEA